MLKFAIALTAALTCNLSTAQDCSSILSHGIYNSRTTEFDTSSASSYSQWFCDNKFSSSQQADSFGASLSFPFKGLPVKFGFDSNSQSYTQWQSSFCGNIKQSQTLQTRLRDHVQTINPVIFQAFNKCLESNGLHVWLERSPDPFVFVFAARWNAPDTERDPTTSIQSFSFGKNVKCEDKPNKISNSEFRTRCFRKDENSVVGVVTTKPGPIRGGGTLTLPVLYKAPDITPPPPQILPACVDATTVVRALYKTILERDPDETGLIHHTSRLVNGSVNVRQMVGDFVQSPEHAERFAKDKAGPDQIKVLYRHILGREGEPDGIAQHVGLLSSLGYTNIAGAIVNSIEYDQTFGNWVVPERPAKLKYCR